MPKSYRTGAGYTRHSPRCFGGIVARLACIADWPFAARARGIPLPVMSASSDNPSSTESGRRLGPLCLRSWGLAIVAIGALLMFWGSLGGWHQTVIGSASRIGMGISPLGNFTAVLSADDRFLASWANGEISIYQFKAARATTIIPYARTPLSLRFSKDGSTLAAIDNSQVLRLYNLPAGSPIFDVKYDRGNLDSMAMSPDGRRLAIYNAYSGSALWDCVNRKRLVYDRRGFWASSMTFTPGGRVFVAIIGAQLRRWSAQRRQPAQ